MTDAAPLTPTDARASVDIPVGFRPIAMGGPFMAHNGPLYARWTGERIQLGFRVLAQHCNPIGTCHGGMLATFADMLLPSVALYQALNERHFLPTISLQMDYLSAATNGVWVQGEGEVLRTTRNMVFLQGLVTADGTPCLRASGVFKLGQIFGKSANMDPYRIRSSPFQSPPPTP